MKTKTIANTHSHSLEHFLYNIYLEGRTLEPIPYRDQPLHIQNAQIRHLRARQFIAEFEDGTNIRAVGFIEFVALLIGAAKEGKLLLERKIYTSYCYNYLLKHAIVEVGIVEEEKEEEEVKPKATRTRKAATK